MYGERGEDARERHDDLGIPPPLTHNFSTSRDRNGGVTRR